MSEPSEALTKTKREIAKILCNDEGLTACSYSLAEWHLRETSQLRAENERLRHALQDAALSLDYSWADFRIKQAEALIRVKEALHPLKDQHENHPA